ncbi:MAG: FAD-dependent oxidoreductase, partial [SAR324 cluster bacterium]|nr:FAD-dependent oxidoreductase [SAR324 cluster bacterium]
PGTPSSEVTDSFARIAKSCGIHFEYSVNEKIALEMAFAASLAGTRSICAMKHLGLVYAGDPLSTIPYVGTVGGMVIVSAGDPSCRTSPNEQDQRYLGDMLHIPVLDPSTPREAYEMTRFAFELSESSNLPVILRIVTHVCHSRAPIIYGRLKQPEFKGFQPNPSCFVPLPAHAVQLRLKINERLEIAGKKMSDSGFFETLGRGKLGILATGAPAAVCADLIKEQNLEDEVTVFITGMSYPTPRERLRDFLVGFEQVLIVEELSPYLEDTVSALCHQFEIPTKILGKRTGHLPGQFEYDTAIIHKAIAKCLGIELPLESAPRLSPVPPRPPSLCPGCPHRSTYFAARAVFGDDTLYFNDIGCYSLGFAPPLSTADALLCMGAAYTLASGVSRTTGRRTIGFLGDSTFFHSGMTSLLNAIKEKANIVAVIMDNQVTAMTGFQDSPGVQMVDNYPVRDISIENVVRALGADQVVTVDPHHLPTTLMAFEKAKNQEGVRVVIAKHPCPVYLAKGAGSANRAAGYEVVHAWCQHCGKEAEGFRCGADTLVGYERHMARGRALEVTKSNWQSQTAPCSDHCPLSICIQGYVGHIASQNYQEAFQMIMDQCPLPETTCRVCHKPCEPVCVREATDEAIGINDLKRFAIQWANDQDLKYAPSFKPAKRKKVAIIGAGPSGLAAAHDLRVRGYEATIFDAEMEPGGLLLTGIPDYRLPREALQRDINRILEMGVSFEGGQRLFENFTIEELFQRGFEAVFLGVGAQRGVPLNLLSSEKDAKKPEIVDALAYLRSINLTQPGFTGQKVLVIGGGNAAIDAARTAKRQGAETVSIVYRRKGEDMPAAVEEIEGAVQEGIEIHAQYQPLSILSGERGGLDCLRTQPGPLDGSGRSRPVPVEGSKQFFEADQIIVAIGQELDPSLTAATNLSLDFQLNSLIKVNQQNGQTSDPRIFSGGDVVDGDRTVTGAIAWGKLAAWGIDCQLGGREQAGPKPKTPGINLNSPPMPDVRRADLGKRQQPFEREPGERISGYAEVREVLTEEQALTEAARCLVCGSCGNCRTCIDVLGCPAFSLENGKVNIDLDLCNGCGICAVICPNGAIQEVRHDK